MDNLSIGKIGIDRIILNNFEIENFNELNKREYITELEYYEELNVSTELFKLSFSSHLNITKNDIFTISEISFNPNKILNGNNVNNSDINELIQAKDIIKKMLNDQGVKISFENARIKEIELNINLDFNFSKYNEVFLAIGRANYKRSIGMYSFEKEDIPKKIKRDRTLYINLSGRTIKFYDKKFESKLNYNLELKKELLRTEIIFERDFYRNAMKKKNLDNNLSTLINNFEILERIFVNELNENVFIKTQKYIENNLKNNLESEYLEFKNREKRKRETKRILKSKGEDYSHIKEIRGVYHYLNENSWIFDKEFLSDIIIKNVASKHQKREIEIINNKYYEIINLERFKKLKKRLILF